MKFKFLTIESKNPALWVTLNRPEVKNAFNLELGQELLSALKMAIKDKKHPVVVLTGAGGAFSAGGDIQLMSKTKNHKNFFLEISRLINACVTEMRKSPKPILAAIPGYVGGVALGAVLGTDLRIASTEAQFNAATIRIALVANGSATYFLPRMVGLARASEILFLGNVVPAEEALNIGLINRVVSPENLEAATQEIALKLSQSPRKALAHVKKILNQSLMSTLPAQMERERQSIAWASTQPDFKEGITAFLEKRKPTFNKS